MMCNRHDLQICIFHKLTKDEIQQQNGRRKALGDLLIQQVLHDRHDDGAFTQPFREGLEGGEKVCRRFRFGVE